MMYSLFRFKCSNVRSQCPLFPFTTLLHRMNVASTKMHLSLRFRCCSKKFLCFTLIMRQCSCWPSFDSLASISPYPPAAIRGFQKPSFLGDLSKAECKCNNFREGIRAPPRNEILGENGSFQYRWRGQILHCGFLHWRLNDSLRREAMPDPR